VPTCGRGFSPGFAFEPAREFGDDITSPQVIHKPSIALHDARRKIRSLLNPALSPHHDKQAAGDDAVSVKLENVAIELVRSVGISPKLSVAPQYLGRSNERLPRPGIGRTCLGQLFIRDHLAK
jgi:hypothetical protein